MKFSTLPVVLLLLSILPAASCGSGEAQPACRDLDCKTPERCVEGACRPPCEGQDDCPIGQNCVEQNLDSGNPQSFCVVLDYARNGSTGQQEPCTADSQCDSLRGYRCQAGRCASTTAPTQTPKLFTSCEKDADCDLTRGHQCIEGACRVACSGHFDCTPIGLCESVAGGTYCSQGPAAKPGQYYASCVNGTADCDSSAGFVCVGSGVGDLDAYCTTDCAGTADCPTGFACETLGATPCEEACGLQGQAVAGCVKSSEIGAGRRYHCQQPIGLVRSVCRKREFCDTCERDEDCRSVPGGICARDQSGAKNCTVECDPSVDSCPWGAATECGLWDEQRKLFTCAHRFGSCRGRGNACDPCANTADCMGKGYCTQASFTGEQFCIDLTLECDCGADADASGTCTGHGCPDSPGGRPMLCYSDSRFPGDPLSHRCVAAGSGGNPIGPSQSGCWVR
ncbi:MAG TPA: hypothetical protein VFQ61_11055 [Polyangiaceae bacterium]|nr:hypothetical protein [Polyangiaceae bacterium]